MDTNIKREVDVNIQERGRDVKRLIDVKAIMVNIYMCNHHIIIILDIWA